MSLSPYLRPIKAAQTEHTLSMDLTRRATLGAIFTLPLAPSLARADILPWQTRLIRAARAQIGVTRRYDPAYVSLDYPMGDVPRDRGVCTDVIIRAYRDAFSFDFQKVLHKDMRNNFSAYPKIWGLSRADKNIDHRRVPNLETWLKRNEAAYPSTTALSQWQPGDLYTMRLGGRLPHIAIISDRYTASGHPYVIHNIGAGTSEDDILGQHEYERRFRFQPPLI